MNKTNETTNSAEALLTTDVNCAKVLQNKRWPRRVREQAFKQIYDRHSGPLKFYFFKNTKSKDNDAVEEFVAITMAKAYEKIDTFVYGAFSTWLYTIAKHTLIDQIRKDKSKQPVEFIHDLGMITDDGETLEVQIQDMTVDSPDSICIENEQKEYLKKIIDSFDHPEMKEIMKLRIEENMQYEEIAEKFKMSLGTVKCLIFRAKNIIKEKEFLFS